VRDPLENATSDVSSRMGMDTRDFLVLGCFIFKFEPLLPPVLDDDHNRRFRPTASCEMGVEYRDVGAFPPPRDDDDRDCFLLVALRDTLDDDDDDDHDKNDVQSIASILSSCLTSATVAKVQTIIGIGAEVTSIAICAAEASSLASVIAFSPTVLYSVSMCRI